jgi:hypothetical protein
MDNDDRGFKEQVGEFLSDNGVTFETDVTFRRGDAAILREASEALRKGAEGPTEDARPPKREAVDISIWPAPEAEAVGVNVVKRWHPDLADARILYLFTDQDRKSKGRTVWATTKKLAPEAKYLSSGPDQDIGEGHDFLVLISGPIWKKLTSNQQIALIDHELCHAFGKETDQGWKWGIVGHEVEEFRAVIKRHGFWNETVRDFGDVCAEQLRLIS